MIVRATSNQMLPFFRVKEGDDCVPDYYSFSPFVIRMEYIEYKEFRSSILGGCDLFSKFIQLPNRTTKSEFCIDMAFCIAKEVMWSDIYGYQATKMYAAFPDSSCVSSDMFLDLNSPYGKNFAEKFYSALTNKGYTMNFKFRFNNEILWNYAVTLFGLAYTPLLHPWTLREEEVERL